MLVRYREARSLPRLPHEDTAYTMHILQVTNHAPCLPPSARSASLVTPNHPEHERHLPKQVIGPVRYGVARGGDSGGTAPGLCRILDMNSGENPQGEVRKGVSDRFASENQGLRSAACSVGTQGGRRLLLWGWRAALPSFLRRSRRQLLSTLPVAASTGRYLEIPRRSLEIPSLHFSARCMAAVLIAQDRREASSRALIPPRRLWAILVALSAPLNSEHTR
jgi:hypothetical protein